MSCAQGKPDVMETLGGSLIQHGPANQRIYLMKLDRADMPELPERLVAFARTRGYGKIFAVTPADATAGFLDAGYLREAAIRGYFRGEMDADLLGFYLDPDRARRDETETDRILELAMQKAREPVAPPPLPESWTLRAARPEDAEDMAGLYRVVFETYPFPIHDPAYLRQTMAEHILYYGIWRDRELVALSSAETRPDALSVEMTDFATHPGARGASLARHLLSRMDEELAGKGYRTAYTIARAASPGMNICFARGGYAWGGTLWNNTQICGRLEHMNVWHKTITLDPPAVISD